jgi:hypothetical protein
MIRAFFVRCLAAGMGFLTLSPLAAHADLPRSLFTVEAVPVDATNPLPVRARESAIAQAHALGFARLIRRFVPDAEAARFPMPNAAELERLTSSIEVVDEKTAGARYVAHITVVFKPDEIRKRLRSSGQIYSLTQGKPALLVVVGDNATDPVPLRHALENQPKGAWLQPGLLPINEAEADLTQAGAGEPVALAAIAQRSGLKSLAVVKIISDPALPGAPPAPTNVSLSVQTFAPNEVKPDQWTARAPAQSFRPSPEGFDGLDGFWTKAAILVLEKVNEPWKRDTALDLSVQINVDAQAEFTGLGDWLVIREALANQPSIIRSELIELTTNHTRLALSVAGAPDKLAFALAQRDIRLTLDGALWRMTRMAVK